MQPDFDAIDALLRLALLEDIGSGDVTSHALIPENLTATAHLVAREPMVLAGLAFAPRLIAMVDGALALTPQRQDGNAIAAGEAFASLHGPARSLLAVERTLLNLLQRMCGVATLTRRYVEAVSGTGVMILDTRKTIPGWRALDKYATRMGGAVNHRMGLYDMLLIKDNHIALSGNIASAVAAGRKMGVPVVVECDTLDQLSAALVAKPDRILLDNMDLASLREAVAITAGRVPLEASGGVSLANLRAIAETGINAISIGRITHSAVAVDIGLDM